MPETTLISAVQITSRIQYNCHNLCSAVHGLWQSMLNMRYISTKTWCASILLQCNVLSCHFLICSSHEGTHTHWSLTSGLCLSWPFEAFYSRVYSIYSSEVWGNILGVRDGFPIIPPSFWWSTDRHSMNYAAVMFYRVRCFDLLVICGFTWVHMRVHLHIDVRSSGPLLILTVWSLL